MCILNGVKYRYNYLQSTIIMSLTVSIENFEYRLDEEAKKERCFFNIVIKFNNLDIKANVWRRKSELLKLHDSLKQDSTYYGQKLTPEQVK